MAALLFLVLSHKLPHARGERVSAGPGVEYIVGNDGLLYQCSVIKVPGKGSRFQAAPLPGVHPDHAPNLLRSTNIREVKDYKGPVFSAKAAGAPVVPAGGTVDKAAFDALQASHGEVSAHRDSLLAENEQLRARLAKATAPAGGEPKSPDAPRSAPPPPPAAPSAAPPPPPAPPAPQAPPAASPPAATTGDNGAGAPDIAAILGLSVGKLGAELAAGKHDSILDALRSAEVAGKNRTGALGVIDARIAALKG